MVEEVVASVNVDEEPEATEADENVAVTPAGTPLAARAMVDGVTADVATVVVADPPCVTVPAALESDTVKGCVVTVGNDIAQALLAFDQLACIAKMPVAKATFCAPPVPPVPTQAQRSPFSLPVEVAYQPPLGQRSVIDSAYSWPATIVTPSKRPAVPALT